MAKVTMRNGTRLPNVSATVTLSVSGKPTTKVPEPAAALTAAGFAGFTTMGALVPTTLPFTRKRMGSALVYTMATNLRIPFFIVRLVIAGTPDATVNELDTRIAWIFTLSDTWVSVTPDAFFASNVAENAFPAVTVGGLITVKKLNKVEVVAKSLVD